MTNPITPPPELVQRLYGLPQMRAIEAAFQAGADQELEACCKMLYDRYDRVRHATGFPGSDMSDWLRAARRPKPPSLKEQALEALKDLGKELPIQLTVQYGTVRHALEQLPD
jgi:hypothetical protein